MFLVVVSVILLIAIVGGGIIGEKLGKSEGEALAKTAPLDSNYNGIGCAPIIFLFVASIFLMVYLILSGSMKESLFVLSIPFIVLGLTVGFSTGKEDGFRGVMDECIREHKKIIKEDKRRMRKAKIRKLIRFWE